MRVPILSSVDIDKIKSLGRFMNCLRGDPAVIAAIEAEKLKPYLTAFSQVLKEDIQAASKAQAATLRRLKTPVQPRSLRGLFKRVAQVTHNVVLSEMVIVPDHEAIGRARFWRPDEDRWTTYDYRYSGRRFSSGFIQLMGTVKKGGNSGSVPVLQLDDKMMKAVARFSPCVLLKHLQDIVTASNHDMQHHYTNQALNPIIAQDFRSSAIRAFSLRRVWHGENFTFHNNDSISNYESWLVMNHARVRRVMERTGAADELPGQVTRFFRELKEIGREMSSVGSMKKAHETVDYFGMVFCTFVARFVPLDHPLLKQAVALLHDADPKPQLVEKQSKNVFRRLRRKMRKDANLRDAVRNYTAASHPILPAKAEDCDYTVIKMMQLIEIAPLTCRLLSPARSGTVLSRMQARVGILNREMFAIAAKDVGFRKSNGHAVYEFANGSRVEHWMKKGKLHRKTGPALQQFFAKRGASRKVWCTEGRPRYLTIVWRNGERRRIWYKDGRKTQSMTV